MATQATFYFDTASFANATTVFTDQNLTNIAPNGWYSDQTIVRQQSAGVLFAAQSCSAPIPVPPTPPTPPTPTPTPTPTPPTPTPQPTPIGTSTVTYALTTNITSGGTPAPSSIYNLVDNLSGETQTGTIGQQEYDFKTNLTVPSSYVIASVTPATAKDYFPGAPATVTGTLTAVISPRNITVTQAATLSPSLAPAAPALTISVNPSSASVQYDTNYNTTVSIAANTGSLTGVTIGGTPGTSRGFTHLVNTATPGYENFTTEIDGTYTAPTPTPPAPTGSYDLFYCSGGGANLRVVDDGNISTGMVIKYAGYCYTVDNYTSYTGNIVDYDEFSDCAECLAS